MSARNSPTRPASRSAAPSRAPTRAPLTSVVNRPPREATRPGGLGTPFDWRLLENLDPRVPFMLSGGLDSDNVAEALAITRAGGVDVSSGVERAPGEKDPDRIRAFIRAARTAAERLGAKIASTA